MAITQGDIVEVTIDYLKGSDLYNSVLHYFCSVVNGAISELEVAEQFLGAFAAGFASIMHQNFIIGAATADNLTDAIGTGRHIDVTAGTITGEAAPEILAMGFEKVVPNKLTRTGGLRVPGVGESVVVGDLFTAPVHISDCDGLAVALGNPLLVVGSGTDDATLEPIVLGVLPDGSKDLARFNFVDDFAFNTVVTNQVSRKG